MTDLEVREARRLSSSRFIVPKGFVTIAASTVVLFAFSWFFAPSSVSHGALLGMLPFFAVLAIVGLGQMLVIQQGGIDLSVPGAISLTVVIVTHQPDGQDSKLGPAVLLAIACLVVAGLINGFLVGRLRLNAIIATLGMNALLYGMVFYISGGTPRTTTHLLASIAGGASLSVPNTVWFAIAALLIVSALIKRTVAGRRFEAIGAGREAAQAMGLRVWLHESAAYLWAQLLYCLAGVLLAGVITQPTAFQGDFYLLPSVAVVVLAGASLLGGRGYPVATVIAALFLTQLGQFVLSLGVPQAVQTLVQAGALAVGVAIFTVNWRAVRAQFGTRLPTTHIPS